MPTTTHHRIPVGTTISGSPIELHAYTVTAEKPGKRVYIQSGMHGGEITYWIQHRLYHFLTEHMIAGEVIFVPFANPASWEQTSYFYTHGKFSLYDGRDFNYNFPGHPAGTLNQRFAHHLFALAKTADLALDLHTARNSVPYCIYSKDEYAPVVRRIGLTYNFLDTERTPDSFDDVMDPAGITNICIECGSHDEYDAAKNDLVFAGIIRVLADMGLVSSEHGGAAPQAYSFATHKKITAQESGFIRYDTALGAPFKKGERIFTLYATAELGRETAEIATEDGIVYKRAPTHIYRVGDDTVHYIPASALTPL